MKNLKIGIREIVFFALLTAIPLGTWWFVFRPNNARDAKVLQEINAKQLKLRELNYATATIGDLRKEIADLEKAVTFFQSKLPSEKEIDKVLREVWRVAEKNQLVTKSIRTMDRANDRVFTDENSPHCEQPITMKLEGDFMGFYSFLLDLENQPRIMRIRQMKITKPEKGPDGCMRAEIIMSIFFERNTKGQS
jgi:Tfp pilus assembly protein PilO